MQILILGMHRSGTSVTARLINMMGAYFGPEGAGIGLYSDNPKGHWERRDVMNINDELLKLQKCSWQNPAGWRAADAKAPDKLRHTMQELILNLDAHRPWFLKDPRLCLTLPAWSPLLEVPVAIIVARNPFEIAISLQKRNKFPIEYGIALWEHYAVGMLNASQNMPRIYVRHADLLQKPVKTCEALFTELFRHGVRRIDMPAPKEIRAFIDQKLYRSVSDKAAVSALSPEQKILSQMLAGMRQQNKAMQVSERSQSIIRAGLPEAA